MPMHLFCYKLLLLLLIKFSSSSKSSHPSSASVSLSLSVYTCVCTIIPMYVWMGHECATVHTQRPVNLRCLSLPSTSLEKRLCCCFSMVYSWPVSVLGILLSLSLELLTRLPHLVFYEFWRFKLGLLCLPSKLFGSISPAPHLFLNLQDNFFKYSGKRPGT